MKRTYLDWAAAAPVGRASERAYVRALSSYGNPQSPHAEGRAASDILTDARVRIARLAGVKPDAVVFTGSATEANAVLPAGDWQALTGHGFVSNNYGDKIDIPAWGAYFARLA